MFNDEQKIELGKPLSKSSVRTREQSGRRFSYIEGWHAIAEANRVFGFDGWSRETVDLRCLSERERAIGQNKSPGFGVSYFAKVRVRVGDIIREGCGSGHGIDRDCGQAHESAIKEAETDAMKRALMTFGNIFGLALYDKEQTNVAADEPRHYPSEMALQFVTRINDCMTVKALDNYGASIAETVGKMDANEAEIVRGHFGERKKALKKAEGLAA
jgi:DNA recombination protein Rad52